MNIGSLRKSLLAASLMLAFTQMPAQNTAVSSFVHEVKVGETLYGISQMYGVTAEAIKSLNPNMGETIMTGQKIQIPQSDNGTVHHTIHAGETLYSITRKYGITAQELCDANPGLSATNFRAGEVIVIPKPTSAAHTENIAAPKQKSGCKQMYCVEKKETIYSISKKFGIAENELLAANPNIKGAKIKKGQYLCIPYSASDTEPEPQPEDVFKQLEPEVKMFKSVKAALILPFNLETENKSSENLKMLDFYEGFLLAVDSLKTCGMSVDLYVYDEKGSSASVIDNILSQPMMKYVNMIVGPVKAEHIPAVSKFAEDNDICLVVPFSSKDFVANSATHTFQINAPQASVYNKVYTLFMEQNPDVNVVFVGMNDKNDKSDYIIGFKKALDAKGISYQRISFTEIDKLQNVLKSGKKNILIPSSGSQNAFEQLVGRLNALESTGTYNISMFGYPEWQAFSAKSKKNLAKYGAVFFASFYNDASSSRTAQFERKFSKWFNRSQYNSYPRYGLLGYDVAAFFIKGMNDYGTSFVSNQKNIKYHSLQNPFDFERKNNWSGFVNNSVMLVKYNPNGSVNVLSF
ncbi:MAG: LysM peptidoglycan-binding domain-containing protein [Bacteroides sp.]|nr:LysM peptidoglycan-binding domain-containing protein [Roseburia sp.]MCM1346775.1 LysM peptidoglycan-binding domain-containing protein [Bacteroides sp.]MCM1420659.1 LysM peptidoglycan-binding domain-containing protein [Bacteroides sp.]